MTVDLCVGVFMLKCHGMARAAVLDDSATVKNIASVCSGAVKGNQCVCVCLRVFVLLFVLIKT